MRATRIPLVILVATLCFAGSVRAHGTAGCDVAVLVDGVVRPEYRHHGTVYVEALRGREYALELKNPTPHRVAVALAVDGLNTIDAKHTDGWRAAKWVLDPWETIVISGWQVSDSAARRFFFTGERDSYAAALGATENLGVIEAIFYRERPRPAPVVREKSFADGSARRAPSAVPMSAAAAGAAEDEYAATGMGARTRHDVRRVHLDLDPEPVAKVRIRYEYRPQLVKLGVLSARRTPLEKREKARGFEDWCPEPR